MAKTSLLKRFSDALRGVQSDITELRERRLRLLEKINELEVAPLTDAEIGQRVDALLDSAEHDARSRLSFEALSGRGEYTSTDSGIAKVLGASNIVSIAGIGAVSSKPEVLGALCLLGLRSTFRENLIREAIAVRKGQPMTEIEREGALRRLRADLLDCEAAEEAAISEAAAAGVAIARRPDADMAIVLRTVDSDDEESLP